MNEQDYKTVKAMERYGGSFAQALANCCKYADSNNLSKIKATWHGMWEMYEGFSKREIEFNGDDLVKNVEDFARNPTMPELIKENEDVLNEYTKQPNGNKSDNS